VGPISDARDAREAAWAATLPSRTRWVAAAIVLLLLLSLLLLGSGVDDRGLRFVVLGTVGLVLVRVLAKDDRVLPWQLGAAEGFLMGAGVAALTDHATLAGWVAAAGALAVVSPASPPHPTDVEGREQVWGLVDETPEDSLAAFALRSDKAHVFSPDGRAAVAYRVKLGTAVVGGDPIGDPISQRAAVTAFLAKARDAGWRVAVLGGGEEWLPTWRAAGLRAVPIGREVLLDPTTFSLEGRRFRNLRQAVQRTRNSGITTTILTERDLSAAERAELLHVVEQSGRSTQPRGFAMILDGLLTGIHPGTLVAVARDASGTAVGFQRFATADAGRELSLDVPYRTPDAPNGIDERLAVDVVEWARVHDARRVSLAFAPFPELFGNPDRRGWQRLAYFGVRRLDRFIKVESLYRYLRKFHSFGPQRYVALRPVEVVGAAVAMLLLEFSRPRRRRRG
jgi:lysylphosphatidylglycerol synthetase-like protein (DUF2156 family)